MAKASLVFDILAKDNASKAFRNIGDNAERAGKKGLGFGSALGKGMAAAGAAFAGAQLGKTFAGFISDARESAKIGRLTEAVIKSTGGSAGVTAKQVGSLATAISNKTGADDEAVQSGANLLLTFTKVRNGVGAGNDIFNKATFAATNMAAALGTDTKGAALQLGKALNDPIKGVSALGRAGVSFTAQQKEQIKTLVESGRTMDAQKIILGEMQTQFGGAAKAAADPMQRLKVIAGNLGEELGGKLLPYIDKGATFLSAFGTALVDGNSRSAMMSTTAGQLADKVRNFGTVIGTEVLPRLKDLGGFLAGSVLPKLEVLGSFVKRNLDFFVPFAAAIGTVAVGFKLYAFVTKTAAAAQLIFNTVLTANPIGLVVIALAGLAAGVFAAYKRSETFRNAVNALWDGIKRFVGFTPMGALITNFDTVKTAINGAWDRAKDFFSAMKDFKLPGWVKTLGDVFGSVGGGMKSAGSWLKSKNPFGDGPGIGGTDGPQPRGVAQMMARLPKGTRLISGFRPGAITATGNRSYHSMGRAVDLPPSMPLFNYILSRFGKMSKELIFTPAGMRQVHNGRSHFYANPRTQRDHVGHIHWAMAKGGVIGEPVRGTGLRSGQSYLFGEAGPEAVLPLGSGRGRGGGDTYNITFGNVYGADSRQLAMGVRDELVRMKRNGVALGFV
jgi:hypothetical protein